MKTINPQIATLFMLLLVFTMEAQQKTDLEGRVYSKNGDVSGTHVINSTTHRATITDVNGFFTIPVRLNDTLVFSAVQFKRKSIVVTQSVFDSKLLLVPLEDELTVLDEVVVMPYNLSGDLKRDMGNLHIEHVVTSSTLGLPNAYVKVKTQNERKLFEADNGKFVHLEFDSLLYIPMVMINLNKILNRITGRTQKLKKYIVADARISLLAKVRTFYPDSIYVRELKIPEGRLDEFMYFCEADTVFQATVKTNDPLKVWEFLQQKSFIYKKNHGLE